MTLYTQHMYNMLKHESMVTTNADTCIQPLPRFPPLPPPGHTHMQWTQKQAHCISQSDPYHYLPCKAHLAGSPDSSDICNIYTFPVMLRITTVTFSVCEAPRDSENRKAAELNRAMPREETEFSGEYQLTERQVILVIATSTQQRLCLKEKHVFNVFRQSL